MYGFLFGDGNARLIVKVIIIWQKIELYCNDWQMELGGTQEWYEKKKGKFVLPFLGFFVLLVLKKAVHTALVAGWRANSSKAMLFLVPYSRASQHRLTGTLCNGLL
jgi:hypothetical protein